MSESFDPNAIFGRVQQGIESCYVGRDERYGVEMWEYELTESEVAEANAFRSKLDLAQVDTIRVGRNVVLSSLDDGEFLVPGTDSVLFQLKSDDSRTIISLSKSVAVHELLEDSSDIIVIEKDMLRDNAQGGLLGLLEALVSPPEQAKEVSIDEMLAISELTKMLPGNRDSA